ARGKCLLNSIPTLSMSLNTHKQSSSSTLNVADCVRADAAHSARTAARMEMEIQTTITPQKTLKDQLVGAWKPAAAAFSPSGASTRQLMRHCLSLMLVGLLAGTTAAKTQGDPRIADLVQAGKVRIGLFPSFFYSKNQATGELQGVGIEIA